MAQLSTLNHLPSVRVTCHLPLVTRLGRGKIASWPANKLGSNCSFNDELVQIILEKIDWGADGRARRPCSNPEQVHAGRAASSVCR